MLFHASTCRLPKTIVLNAHLVEQTLRQHPLLPQCRLTALEEVSHPFPILQHLRCNIL